MKLGRFIGGTPVVLVKTAVAVIVMASPAESQTLDSFSATLNAGVYAIAPQPSGMVLLGGGFTTLDGQTRNLLGRVNLDGSLDAFNPAAGPQIGADGVDAFGMQPDGKILVGGSFSTLAGQSHFCFGRVDNSGTADTVFSLTGGANLGVVAFGIQPDGKILIGGGFTFDAIQRTNIARFNLDGSLDTNFNPGANSTIRTMALQPDGRILVGGDFSILAGQPCSRIGRLNADGSFDGTFNSGTDSPLVYCLGLQADGKVLVGGVFTSLQGQSRTNLARLNDNGSLDMAFNPGASGSPILGAGVYACVLQADGGILVGGSYYKLGGLGRTNLGRLNPDGTADTNFVANARGISALALALQSDGKILISGNFTNLAGANVTNLARIMNTGGATQDLSFNGSTITWQRGGTSPEAWRTTFEYSSDGTNWSLMGAGTRVSGGWQFSGLTPSTSGTIRARGFVRGGYGNGSEWYVESTLAYTAPVPLMILTGDAAFGFSTNAFGFGVIGPPTTVAVIEASTNLVDWIPLSTNTLGGTNPVYFSDTDAFNHAERVYRAREQ